MEREKSFTRQCSIKPVCHPQGHPGETSLREEASGSALSTSPAFLSHFPPHPQHPPASGAATAPCTPARTSGSEV